MKEKFFMMNLCLTATIFFMIMAAYLSIRLLVNNEFMKDARVVEGIAVEMESFSYPGYGSFTDLEYEYGTGEGRNQSKGRIASGDFIRDDKSLDVYVSRTNPEKSIPAGTAEYNMNSARNMMLYVIILFILYLWYRSQFLRELGSAKASR